MQTQYLRNTHDKEGNAITPSGETRESWNKKFQALEGDGAFVVHMLSSKKPLNFDAIVKEVNRYNECYNEPLMPRAQIALGLCAAVQAGFVKTIEV